MGTRGIVVLQRINGGRVVGELEFPNLITNVGLDSAANDPGWRNYCRVGTGTTAPTPTDSTLGAQIAATQTSTLSNANAASVSDPGTTTVSHTFPVGAVVGNITEIGYGATETGALSVRALITDSLGNPTSFPVAANEQLRAIYVRQIFAPASDIVTTQSLGATTYGVTIRCTQVTGHPVPFQLFSGNNSAQISANSVLPTYGNTISGAVSSTTYTNGSYSAGSFSREFSGSWAAGNGTGEFRTAQFTLNGFRFAMLYDAPIVKPASFALTIPISLVWSRR